MSKSDDDLFIESLARCAEGNQGRNSVIGKKRVNEVVTPRPDNHSPTQPITPVTGPGGGGRGKSLFPLRDIKADRQAQAQSQPGPDTGHLKGEVEQIRSQLEGLLHRLEGVLSQL